VKRWEGGRLVYIAWIHVYAFSLHDISNTSYSKNNLENG
jgi:hypothetical protein